MVDMDMREHAVTSYQSVHIRMVSNKHIGGLASCASINDEQQRRNDMPGKNEHTL
jgi:hypothetical protein